MQSDRVSNAVTQGIRVRVESKYMPDESTPADERWVFAYTVTVANESDIVVQLVSRHWIITDANGHVEEVKGPGVVGAQPVLRPGQAFRYTSGCHLRTPRGTMHGTYQMVREDGTQFDAEIAPFVLVAPTAPPTRYLN
jgi:ApaG protein